MTPSGTSLKNRSLFSSTSYASRLFGVPMSSTSRLNIGSMVPEAIQLICLFTLRYLTWLSPSRFVAWGVCTKTFPAFVTQVSERELPLKQPMVAWPSCTGSLRKSLKADLNMVFKAWLAPPVCLFKQ